MKSSVNILSNLKSDLPASVVVFLVATPLCLGIALASGAPLFSGIIAGIVGGIVVGAISGSSLGVSGPAAGLAVIVLNSIATLGSWEIFLMAVVLSGIIQLVLGFLKAGIIGYYFPSSVIKGMLSGIGIIFGLIYVFSYASFYSNLLSLVLTISGTLVALYALNKYLNNLPFIQDLKSSNVFSIIYHLILSFIT